VPIITSNISGYGSNSVIGISGSIVFQNPQIPGSDTTFFVSGSSSARAVFAGTMVVSGSLVTSGSSFLGDNTGEDTLQVKAATFLLGTTSIGTTSSTSVLIVSGSSSAATPVVTIKGGVSSPADAAGLLDVQNSSGSSLLFVTGTLGTIGGRVGIGTNNPQATLHVSSSYGGSSHGIKIGSPNAFGVATNTYTSLQHSFYGGDGATVRLTIDSGGNILAGGSLGFIANTARLYVTGSSTSTDQGIVYKSGSPVATGDHLSIQNSSGTSLFSVNSNGNTYASEGSTGMTSGFFYIPAAAGPPTAVPSTISGRVPMYYDSSNNRFYIYNGSWKQVALS
jgi:hypothetical protein